MPGPSPAVSAHPADSLYEAVLREHVTSVMTGAIGGKDGQRLDEHQTQARTRVFLRTRTLVLCAT